MADASPPAPQRPLPRWRQEWSWPRFLRNAAIVAALIAWFIVKGVVPNTLPRNFGTVEEGVLYRSGRLPPAALRDIAQTHAIRTIIDFGTYEPGSPEERRELDTVRALGLAYHRLPLYGDGTGDPNRYAEAIRLIEDPANQPVLVHCSAGSERTGALVALYRHHTQGVPLQQAYEECQDHLHRPHRNPRLWEVLETWADEVVRSVETGQPIDFDGHTPP